MEEVNDSKNVTFCDLLHSFRLIHYVDCPTHQLRHILDLIITKENILFAYQTSLTNFISWTIALFIAISV